MNDNQKDETLLNGWPVDFWKEAGKEAEETSRIIEENWRTLASRTRQLDGHPVQERWVVTNGTDVFKIADRPDGSRRMTLMGTLSEDGDTITGLNGKVIRRNRDQNSVGGQQGGLIGSVPAQV